ncbi:hypothetical protein GTQ43_24785 [Nostoc sp. KVJ3]|uniref:FcoT family thioesterase n=1 Tax=Nostoc sp. KVJ3 TaxID=457945 RepID=UPI002237C68E|nr:FcoT family thioesterase [Nostoc sp. KVJ3]MCW5316914.1 hypothetical protein [Nostoc sp. KVJ3]
MNINPKVSKTDDVSQVLLDVFLEPYKDDCKYLRKAQFKCPELVGESSSDRQGLWLVTGDFSIPESCYIAATGHFNSVEFNICYNQLFYIMVAYLIENNLLEVMRDWDLETYKRRQLSNFLIVKFSSTFRKPINSNHFQGSLSINKYSVRGNLIILKTSCAFYEKNGGWSEGDVTIAVLNSEPQETLDENHQSISA